MTPKLALTHLWQLAHGEPGALARVAIDGQDPALPSVFHVGTLAAASIAAAGLAAAECHRLRTGVAQRVDVSVRDALVAFRSERYLRVDDGPPPELRHPVTGFYETRDARWIQLHANFPHHLRGILGVLGCGERRAEVAAAIRTRDGTTLDAALADAGLCAALIRTPDEWAAHEQARALAALPLFEIERIGDAPVQALGGGDASRPLAGVRVLDLTRIIAGPVAGRTLASHGAQVLLVNGPHLPNIAPLVIDNGRGKRSAWLDLRDAAGVDALQRLVRQADVFVDAYRPGALASRGFSPDALAALRPGIVCVSISAYGHAGPWSRRRGFDSLVQSASGIAWRERQAAHADAPRHLPCQALDHATGYLAAFGAMIALARRAREGGSWQVRLSLAQTGRWLQSFGLVPDGAHASEITPDDARDRLDRIASPFGVVDAVRPAERLSATPPFFALPPVPLGADEARWID
ncbi:CoA transferase [Burkholderia ubonensis]|uniref:CoA transferase n=1 Tax=Burkholderia ubonensis TaxID=101571 RepID=UPI000755283C|nr:CoA transferase [Burkholderia ubonensis]AOI71279.1 carnitine dehydratase [Burkholderia ubonensis]KUZ21400.1 carnitine dehydratase [Burkholderia ubonensis]KUZ22898.1 carnitine dehydratase [Burkholderia ubonensis]KUZ26901.1 carnitine dehydratase [Burkholderia ubonensis]KUZ46226.1 carnitine dehydratase [Burkholderia ubonensis]